MTDYIKREDALKELLGCVPTDVHEIEDLDVIRVMLALPSADVAPVVRCKDCVFSTLFQNDSSGAMARYCKAFTIEPMVADNDFCSYGERKDNE